MGSDNVVFPDRRMPYIMERMLEPYPGDRGDGCEFLMLIFKDYDHHPSAGMTAMATYLIQTLYMRHVIDGNVVVIDPYDMNASAMKRFWCYYDKNNTCKYLPSAPIHYSDDDLEEITIPAPEDVEDAPMWKNLCLMIDNNKPIDVLYIEHAETLMHASEEVRRWVSKILDYLRDSYPNVRIIMANRSTDGMLVNQRPFIYRASRVYYVTQAYCDNQSCYAIVEMKNRYNIVMATPQAARLVSVDSVGSLVWDSTFHGELTIK